MEGSGPTLEVLAQPDAPSGARRELPYQNHSFSLCRREVGRDEPILALATVAYPSWDRCARSIPVVSFESSDAMAERCSLTNATSSRRCAASFSRKWSAYASNGGIPATGSLAIQLNSATARTRVGRSDCLHQTNSTSSVSPESQRFTTALVASAGSGALEASPSES